MVRQGQIKDAVVQALWALLADKKASKFALGTLTIVSMVANAKPQTVQANIDRLVVVSLSGATTRKTPTAGCGTCADSTEVAASDVLHVVGRE